MLRLYHELQHRALWNLFDQLEAPLSVILALLELRGLHVNVDVMHRSRDTLQVTYTSHCRWRTFPRFHAPVMIRL